MSEPDKNPLLATRRWTVLASGFLLTAVALVVIYTGRAAFHSLAAVVVMAAIGLVAVLLQFRLRRSDLPVHSTVWLNVIGVLCAIVALFADWLSLSSTAAQVLALAAVGCFAVSSALLLDALRKARLSSKSGT